ncbi:hypothetical protein [Streptomyces sp. KS 21]|uniref:hypothetical protein n=1 Tax=Streptomyces sp. KS 21 TaxID=2485150 RepID=UPI0010E3B687|nr:hypothetical protein [Streptomyces sp. KS 21]TDU80404.1 hypothetical protein EDD91_7247 [Streptomyces sp. KS 21]
MSEFHTEVMTLPNGSAAGEVLTGAGADLSDEEFLERYPRVAEILARWGREDLG